MDTSTILNLILSLGASTILGVIAFFLKRSFNRLDGCEGELKSVRENTVSKSEHEEDMRSCRFAIQEIRDSYTPLPVHDKAYDECRNDIKHIKEDYITREDFYREQGKTDKKLDRIMDILLEMNGGNKRE